LLSTPKTTTPGIERIWRRVATAVDTSAGLGYVVTTSEDRSGAVLAPGSRCLGSRQTAFDAEVAAMETALRWHRTSDSTSAIVRAQHSEAGPGQQTALAIQLLLQDLRSSGRSASLVWVKGHQGTPGSERADVLAGRAAEKPGVSHTTSMAYLKLKISEIQEGCLAGQPRHPGQGTKLSCQDCRPDTYRPLALGGISQADQEKNGWQLLVLPEKNPHDPLPRPPPLPRPCASRDQSGSVGGAGSRQRPRTAVKPEMGEAVCEVLFIYLIHAAKSWPLSPRDMWQSNANKGKRGQLPALGRSATT